MSNILVSGLLNIETTARIRSFPIPYYPIDYPFFGVNTDVAGVGYNLASALAALGDQVRLCSMLGDDLAGKMVRSRLTERGISADHIPSSLRETPVSAVLYDGDGRRQIYCDLKDIQEATYAFPDSVLDGIQLVAACNTNFNRPLLSLAEARGIETATDVHVLSNPDDEYNCQFMLHAKILFLSDEGIYGDKRDFIQQLENRYRNEIIVLGMGARGALMYWKAEGRFFELPAYQIGGVVNTVGAGDSLFGAFLHYYAKGDHPLTALDKAQLFAALKIRHAGAANGFSSEKELESFFHDLK